MNNKYYLNELISIFKYDVTVKSIYEKIYTVYYHNDAHEVKNEMIKRNYDVTGIAEDISKPICGYIIKDELNEGKCIDYKRDFKIDDVISDSTSLIKVIELLKDKKFLFVIEENEVKYIVTKADLNKQTIRILSFGLINLFENFLEILIEETYPNDLWLDFLKTNRRENLINLYNNQRKNNIELSKIDCAQLCDKRDIILKNYDLFKTIFQIGSKRLLEDKLDNIEKLRNAIAHAHEVNKYFSMDEYLEIILDLKDFNNKIENYLKNKRESFSPSY